MSKLQPSTKRQRRAGREAEERDGKKSSQTFSALPANLTRSVVEFFGIQPQAPDRVQGTDQIPDRDLRTTNFSGLGVRQRTASREGMCWILPRRKALSRLARTTDAGSYPDRRRATERRLRGAEAS